MPSDRGHDALVHIHYYIELIGRFVEGYDFARFSDDPRTFHAVTRCLEIISEASRRVPEEVKVRHPSLPWRQMADAGNKYRHEYEDVAERVVWATVHDALPPLLHAIRVGLGHDE